MKSFSLSWGIINLFLLLSTFSCEYESEDNQPPFDIAFKLLNGDGIPSSTFCGEEVIIFSLKIINTSNDDIILSRNGIEKEDIFRVYGTVRDVSGDSIVKDFGKPYGVLFCNKSLGAVLPANDTLNLEIPWSPTLSSDWGINFPFYNLHFCDVNDKEPLKKGKYWSSFTSAFEYYLLGTNHITNTMDFKVDFEICP